MKMDTMIAKMKQIRDRAMTVGVEKMADKQGNRFTEVKMGPLGAIDIPSKKNLVSGVKAAMSIPGSMKKARQGNKDANTLMTARKYKGMPDYDNSGAVTDAFKARSMANEVKERLSKKK